MVNLFVSSLDYSVTQKDLFTLFKPYGYIKKVSVPVDKETGKTRGFAFVEIDAPDATPIIDELNGKELNGRTIVVRLSEDKRGGDSSHSSNAPRSRTSPSNNEGYKPRVSNNEEGTVYKSFEREDAENIIPKSNIVPKKKKSGKKDKDNTSDGSRKLKMSAYKKTKKNEGFIDDDDDDIDMEDFY